ncbi:mCG145636, partial [Mus musculus]
QPACPHLLLLTALRSSNLERKLSYGSVWFTHQAFGSHAALVFVFSQGWSVSMERSSCSSLPSHGISCLYHLAREYGIPKNSNSFHNGIQFCFLLPTVAIFAEFWILFC